MNNPLPLTSVLRESILHEFDNVHFWHKADRQPH